MSKDSKLRLWIHGTRRWGTRAWQWVLRSLKSVWLRNPIRARRIRQVQRAHLAATAASSRRRLIVFLTPGYDVVSGGVMSIVSHAVESQALLQDQGFEVRLCTLPNHPPLDRYSKFDNDQILVSLEDVFANAGGYSDCLIHIPEVHVEEVLSFTEALVDRYPLKFRINVMLQNIDLCPEPPVFERLSRLGSLTCTTAHRAYATPALAARLGCAVHWLSVKFGAEQYEKTSYETKRDLILYSSDYCFEKHWVVKRLTKALPTYRFQEIRGISHREYRRIIGIARYCISFGEGLDGYYAEPALSGAIGVAVFNTRFFTPEFENTPFVYDSWQALARDFPDDVRAHQDRDRYEESSRIQFALVDRRYSIAEYRENLQRFYSAVYGLEKT